jgi:hypothetical protein
VNHAVDFGSYCNGEAKVAQKLQDAMNDAICDMDFDEHPRRLSATGHEPATDDELEEIGAAGEFDLQQSYNSSQNSLQFPN